MSWGDPALSSVLAGGVLGVLTLLWLLLIAGVGAWGRRWRLDPEGAPRGRAPRVSICVPARNEEGRIGGCVEALLAQDYPDLEIVVIDDRSEDDTSREALSASKDDPRFLLISGTDPRPGWAGKPWACTRAAGESTGELLLFVDADVRLAPWATRAAVARFQQDDLALLSIYGTWTLESFWERALVPVVGWFIRGAVDLDAANDPGRPEAFANGQFILVRRDAYDKVGGHGAVKGEVLEDVKLARAFKARALRCGMYYAPEAFRVRLYTSLAEIVRGYGKNLYEGMDRRPALALGAVFFIFVGTLGPFLLLAAMAGMWLATGWSPGALWFLWAAGLCGLVFAFRWRLERADGRSGWYALTHPLGNLVFVWILMRSMFLVETEWKGRTFIDGKAG